jgi:hypothetical protein
MSWEEEVRELERRRAMAAEMGGADGYFSSGMA